MSKKDKSTTIYQPMKYKLIYFLISLMVIIPGVYSLVRYGFQLSIDFTGGSVINLTSHQLQQPQAIYQTAQELNIEVKDVKHQADIWTITTNPLNQNQYQQFFNVLKQQASDLHLNQFYTVGATLGKELVRKTIYGIALAASLILAYVAFRFQNFKFGLSAILAMFHDTLVLLGSFSLLGHFYHLKIDSLFVTAVLTVLSFSVHDTIIVYDRIRELKKHHPYLDFNDVVNRAVVETMGRSINNSMTIIFMLLAMYLLGGSTIHNFILALLIGTISGTYSSIFTASPILVVWNSWEEKRKK